MSIPSADRQQPTPNAPWSPEAGRDLALWCLAHAGGPLRLLAVSLLVTASAPAVGQVLRKTTFEASGRNVTQLAFSPDGKVLATLGYHGFDVGEVRLWDVKTGKEKAKFRLETPSPGYLLAFTPDGKTIVSCCARSGAPPAREGLSYIEVWDVETGKRRLLISPKPGHRGHKGCVCPDGKTLVVTAPDASAALYDLQTGKELAVLAGHNGANLLALSKDGKWLATGCEKGKLGIWDVDKRKLLHLFDAQKGRITALTFRPDGKRVASAGADRIVNVWDRASGNREARKDLEYDVSEIYHLFFTPKGEALVVTTGGAGDSILWWEMVVGRLRGAVEIDPPPGRNDLPAPRKRGPFNTHRQASLSPDGKVLATVNDGPPRIQLWELREKPKPP